MSIYVIMPFCSFDSDRWKTPNDERIVGFYTDKNKAFNAVINNNADIHETVYDYCLIELIEEGFYNPAGKNHRWLFKYNKETEQYEPESEPEEWKGLSGFTIG